MPYPLFVALVALMMLLGGSASAATLSNASFETPSIADGAYVDGSLPAGWSFSTYDGGGTAGTADPPAADLSPVFGENVAYLYGTTSGSAFPYLFQDLGAQSPNTIYSLSGYVGDRLNSDPGPGIARAFPASGVSMNLHVGDTSIASRVASVFIPASPGDGVAAPFTTLTYTSGAAPAGNLFVTLVIAASANSNLELATFDNLVLNQVPVPEPSAISLMLIGAIVSSRRRLARHGIRKNHR